MFSKSALLRSLVLLFALAITSRVEGVELTGGTVSRMDIIGPAGFSLYGPGLSYRGSFDTYMWMVPCAPCFPGDVESTSAHLVLATTDLSFSTRITIDGQTYYNWGVFFPNPPPPPVALFTSVMDFHGGSVEVPLSDQSELILTAPFTMNGGLSGWNFSQLFHVNFNAGGYVSLYLKRIEWSDRPAYMFQAITYEIVPRVDIDVKPGEDPNYINLSSRGKTPIAILSTETFDAGTVDPTTITVAGAPVSLRRNGTTASSLEDVNGDGLLDLVVHVSTEALQPTSLNQVLLDGYTISGQRLWGTDEMILIP